MIVNPAYAYMGKQEPEPDFTFWNSDGSLNVSLGECVNVTYESWVPRLQVNGNGYAQFTINASKYRKIKFNAAANMKYTLSVCAIENGIEYGTESYNLNTSKIDFEFVIPKEFQKNNATFKFYSGPQFWLYSIILTN